MAVTQRPEPLGLGSIFCTKDFAITCPVDTFSTTLSPSSTVVVKPRRTVMQPETDSQALAACSVLQFERPVYPLCIPPRPAVVPPLSLRRGKKGTLMDYT